MRRSGRATRLCCASGRDQTEAFPSRRRRLEHRCPAAVFPMLVRLDVTPREGEFRAIRGERKRRQLVDALLALPNCDARILVGVQRHMLESLLAALAGMHAIEIEREGVEELQLLVVLEKPVLLEPPR